jgi:hypothetical protein
MWLKICPDFIWPPCTYKYFVRTSIRSYSTGFSFLAVSGSEILHNHGGEGRGGGQWNKNGRDPETVAIRFRLPSSTLMMAGHRHKLSSWVLKLPDLAISPFRHLLSQNFVAGHYATEYFWKNFYFGCLVHFSCTFLCWQHNKEIRTFVFPEKELRGLSPNFHIHVSVNKLYIPTLGSHIFL